MAFHKYQLEPYKGMNTRYHCPLCQHRERTFTRYVDTETGKHVAPHVGRCSRENNCGHHYTPKQYFGDNGLKPSPAHFIPQPSPPKPVSYIPEAWLDRSLKHYEQNHFVRFLQGRFGDETTEKLISRYYIGTSSYWGGAALFWQIDKAGKIRAGKIMLYSPDTGKRIKEPFSHIQWVHKAAKIPDFNLKQCLFGEHLLNEEAAQSKPVAIVESEKTAIIASVYLPQFVWMAVGSLHNLNTEKCKVLKDRKVVLFPDLKGLKKWEAKATELSPFLSVLVSDLLEQQAPEEEREKGLDLADYLLRFDHRTFLSPAPDTQPEATEEPMEEPAPIPDTWEEDRLDLSAFFADLPPIHQPIRLDQCTTVSDVPLFIHSHLSAIEANRGKRAFLPYLERLKALKEIVKTLYSLTI